jgi:hypothetical protein
VVAVSPDSLRFVVPATLRVTFDPSRGPVGLPPAEHRLRLYARDSWTGVPGATTDGTTNVVSGAVTTGGLFSAGWAVPATPCTSPESRQFDFWIGRWNVTEKGQASGLSDITVVPGGCAILEHFRSGVVGRSISFYVPQTQQWYQTYVDNAGNRLLLAGRFQNGGIDLLSPPAGGQTHSRTRWSAEGQNVRQEVAALSRNGGATYSAPQYDFVYVPR